MYLENLNVVAMSGYPKETEFNFGTHCVSDLYLSCLGRYHTGRIRKVVITATVKDRADNRSLEPLGVLEVRRPFDFESYSTADAGQRKRLIVEFLHSTMRSIAGDRGWNVEAIESAYQCVLDRNYRNVQRWPEPVSSPDKSRKAQVEYEFDENSVEGFLIVLDHQGNRVGHHHLFSLLPTDFHLYDALGRLAWEDNATVVLHSRLGELRWRAQIV
jgi:hypothetical protein